MVLATRWRAEFRAVSRPTTAHSPPPAHSAALRSGMSSGEYRAGVSSPWRYAERLRAVNSGYTHASVDSYADMARQSLPRYAGHYGISEARIARCQLRRGATAPLR